MAVGNMLNSNEKKLLHQVVLKAEKETAAEIHIAFYKTATHPDVMQEALAYFHKQKLHKSSRKNSVLIYILEADRKFAILGDEGIHQKVHGNYWNELSTNLSHAFKQGHFYQGLVDCIHQLTHDLKHS